MMLSLNFRRHPRTPRGLPADMRAAIDQAVAAGMVRKIDAGVSGQERYVWDERRNQLVKRETADAGPPARYEARLAEARRRCIAQADEEFRWRLDLAEAAFKRGATRARVAEQLGITERTADEYLRRLRREGRIGPGGAGDA